MKKKSQKERNWDGQERYNRIYPSVCKLVFTKTVLWIRHEHSCTFENLNLNKSNTCLISVIILLYKEVWIVWSDGLWFPRQDRLTYIEAVNSGMVEETGCLEPGITTYLWQMNWHTFSNYIWSEWHSNLGERDWSTSACFRTLGH